MKKIYLISTIALAGFMTSCYDLDTRPTSGTLTEDQREEIMEQNPNAVSGLVNGMYANYNEFEMCYGDLLDFGYPALMLQMDSRTADFVSANADIYGWFSECAEYLDNTASGPYSLIRWRWGYNTIFTCNEVLARIPEDTKDDMYKFYRAQAFGNRAFAYWFLAQLFQFNYAYTNPETGLPNTEMPCVPIVTEENMNKVAADGVPRASVEAVYNLILSDLNTGIELMTNNTSASRSDKRYIDLNVLYGLRARTYLCMQKYNEAAADAQRVISSGSFSPLTAEAAIGPGFISLNEPNWMWGVYIASEDVHGLYTLAGMMGSYTYGYAYVGMYKCITNTLFNKISNNDPRKLWWLSPNGNSNAQYFKNASIDPSSPYKTAAQYLEMEGFPPYAVTKFAPYGNVILQSMNQAEYPLMRIEEMYLILAEAQGMGGNLSQGVKTLENFVNNYRWLSKNTPYTCTATTPEEFIDEIFFQREVEFWGEGITYYDIMRLNRGVDRRNTIWTDPTYGMTNYVYNIAPGSAVLLTPIPLSEIDNNKQMTEADQNPVGVATR